MPNVHRTGFTELAGHERTQGSSQEVEGYNIIFVHGLRGHPFETWASRQPAGASSRRQRIRSLFQSTRPASDSNSTQSDIGPAQRAVFWPRDYLVEEIPQARVWTYGYNADVIGGLFQASDKNSVSQHGRNLAVRLEREIKNQDPIIFVAHSLGGIIVKDAIRRSEAGRRRTKFIVFLGTPHRGSGLANWGEIASNLARLALQDMHKKIIETLKVDSEVLDNIYDQFVEVVFEQGIRIHSFQEGRGIPGMRGLHKKVVSDFSSKLGLPKLETAESIDANHIQMARCKDRSDKSYRAITSVLEQFLKGGSSSAACAAPSSYKIPPRNRRFVGRTEKVKELEGKLVISDDCWKLALVGLGGVGKTQVALQLAYTVKERWLDYSIFWVPAMSGESFEQAYRDIAIRCSVALNPTEEDPKESMQRYLSGSSVGKWLLIIDNSDDEEVLFGISGGFKGITNYLPESENGLTLFTTRHREIAVSLAGSEVVEIQKIEDKEAKTFLRQSLTQKELLNNQRVTIELLKELTYLPLAITQAAVYLNARQISIQDYLSLLVIGLDNSVGKYVVVKLKLAS